MLTIRFKRYIILAKEVVGLQMTLKAARVNSGVTQEQAAKMMGVSRSLIQNWERGKSFPDAMHLKKIETAYGVSYDDIVFLPSKTLKA